MKILLNLSVSIFLYAGSFAQEGFRERRLPSQFNKFIERPAITWAMQLFDSLRFKNVNLNALLRSRVKTKEIKATTQISSGRYDDIRYESLQALYEHRFPHHGGTEAIYDSLGNLVSDINDSEPAEYLNDKFDSVSYNLVYVDEVIYVDKGKLNIYIPYVSPAYPIITSMGVYLGSGYYFTSSFNFKHKYSGKRTDKFHTLGQSVKTVVFDSVAKSDVLKQLYGNNLLEAIWEDLINFHKIYRATDNALISKDDLSTDFNKIDVPVYDPNGRLSGNLQSDAVSLLPSNFKKMDIMLEWLYNEKRNIVLAEIKEIRLFNDLLSPPFLRIVW